ncbi:MAG: Na+/H+ antiporter NhaC family protein [Bacteroidales bacterium]|nr:Na+/H+ antiporter NhaC family protein [Bacteroidales bacterium]
MNFIGTFWSLVPSILAIALALITKEVYSSLFCGVILGAALYAISMGTGFDGFITHLLNDTPTTPTQGEAQSYGMIHCLADPWNVGILLFLVILGTMVALMNKAGGSTAFGTWAIKHIRSKVSAQIATVLLGILLFIDDYFNCLTVGSVMRPITVRYGVTREKLAYLIDSTAAPVCIIAPISSWAAAVSGFVSDDENGLALFCSAIPFNFYAFFSIIFMLGVILLGFDFKSMSKYDAKLAEWYASMGGMEKVRDAKLEVVEMGVGAEKAPRGHVSDLVVPITLLITLCVLGMIYSGGYFLPTSQHHMDFIGAFGASDASVGLVIGSLAALLLSIAWYCVRRVLTFDDAMSCLIKGFEAMVPAIIILALAWTLKSMTDALDATTYVASIVSHSAAGLQMLLPAIIFVIAAFLAFATGTSWGTFGILIPICIAVFAVGDPLRIISISACMAGAVCGDHVSPISDTTIMASAGAQCKHLHHVSSQLPYVVSVAIISCASYIIAGLTHDYGTTISALTAWTFGLTAMAIVFAIMKTKSPSQSEAA